MFAKVSIVTGIIFCVAQILPHFGGLSAYADFDMIAWFAMFLMFWSCFILSLPWLERLPQKYEVIGFGINALFIFALMSWPMFY